MFDSAGDAIFLVEPATLRIFEANFTAGRLSGQTLVGRHLAEVFPDLATVTGATELLRTINQPCRELNLVQTAGPSVVGEGRASGVGHDFNNALAKILGFVEILLSQAGNLADQGRTQKFLLMLRATAQDAVSIVDRLREFYRLRKPTDVAALVDLRPLIEQAVAFTRLKWHEQALANGCPLRIVTEFDTTPPVCGQPGDLREVLHNLIFNAVTALPEGGTITLTTRHTPQGVTLIVRDTGTGMSMTEEVRQRCFEPFYSTNGKRGAGLVERQFLATATCTVETAADGAEAWRKFCGGRFDVAVTDRAMPRMNGDQLTPAIKTIAPTIPVILLTGFDLPAGPGLADAVLYTAS